MSDFNVKWLIKSDLKNSTLIKGVPGVGNISHISVDYLVNKLGAELVCKIYSYYLPNIALISAESTLEQPYYALYYKKVKGRKLLFLKNNYPPSSEYYSHKSSEFLADFIKKLGAKEVITIAGIAYKEIPKTIKLFCATNDKKMQAKLKKTELLFTGNKDVGLIIGGAGLLLTQCAERKIPGFCVLVSTWAHPNHVGIKESRRAISFLGNYLGFKIDLSDLDKEIRRINNEAKKVNLDANLSERTEYNKSRYIG